MTEGTALSRRRLLSRPNAGQTGAGSHTPPERPVPVLGWGLIIWGVFIVIVSHRFAEVTSFWWLVLMFGLIVPLVSAVQTIAAARHASWREVLPPVDRAENKQRQLLEALAEGGELSATAVAMRTELTVEEAAELLDGLAGKGHLRVFTREGAMAYALFERDRIEMPRSSKEASGADSDGQREFGRLTGRLFDDRAGAPEDEESLVEPLSHRELEVLGLLESGCSNQEIARNLHVTVGTVKAHASSIYRKLKAKSRAEAASKAREMGLLG